MMTKYRLVLLGCIALLPIFLAYGVTYGYETINYPDSTLLSISDAKETFAALHDSSENYYDGNGGWETQNDIYGNGYYPDDDDPAIKSTARRVIAYIQAYHVTGNTTYHQRAQEGLSFLVNAQESDGRFDRRGTGGESIRDTSDRADAYETALGGRALIEGYREFGTSSYLTAAEQAADWQIEIQDSLYVNGQPETTSPMRSHMELENANHLGFIAWHLASVYQEDANSAYLDSAVAACDTLIGLQIEGGNSDGTWYWYQGSPVKGMAYHSITLRGLLETYWAIKDDPDYSDFKAELDTSITHAINYMIRRQKSTKLLPWSETDSQDCPHGLQVLCLAHDYLEDSEQEREQLEEFIFALAKAQKEKYDTDGSDWGTIVEGDTRHELILSFGQYLWSTIWGKIYPGEVWSGTIRPTGDVIVCSGDSLRIDPGTTVKFAVNKDSYHGPQYTSKCELIVYGKLTADGTASNRITFRSTNTSNPSKSDWYGIRFDSSADPTSVVDHCTIRDAMFGVYLHSNSDSPHITYNTNTNCTYGVYGYYPEHITIEHNTLDYNTYGLYLLYAQIGSVRYNSISHNSSRGVYLGSCSPLNVSSDTVSYNGSYGGFRIGGSCTPYMDSNVVKHNGSYGMYLYSGADPTLVNSKIGYNGSYGIKFYNGSDPVMSYYQSAYNALEDNGSYELYLRYNCQPTLDYGHNDIVPASGGWHIYIDTNYGWSTIYARRNWWGSTDSTTFKFHPSNGVVYSPWDTSPNTGGVGKIVASSGLAVEPKAGAYDLLFQAIDLARDGQYAEASEAYKSVIESYPDSPAARPALSGLLSACRGMGGDLLASRSYFEKLSSAHAGTGLGWKARWLSIDCLELSGDYQSAIAEYQKMHSEAGEDGLAAALRMGEVYLYGLRDTAQASKVFEEIISIAPESEAAFLASEHLAEVKDLPQAEPEPRFEPEVAKVSEQSPGEISLSFNYPNPFNPQTVICFTLPRSAFVSLEVYNILGQRVRSLTDGFRQAGTHSVSWDGKDAKDREVASGVYLYRLVVDKGRFVQTRKLLLIR